MLVFDPLPEIIPSPSFWNLTYWNESYYDAKSNPILEKIQKILFPQYDWKNSFSEDPQKQKKWVNYMCDVLSLFAHVESKGNLFVTSDQNFLNKRQELKIHGIQTIVPPKDAYN